MARPLRLEFPGALYHITSRGNERRPIFRSDRDRKKFLDFLGETARRFGWSITAWVLMTNHFHLVVQIAEPNLSRGMHWLNSRYAGWFNRIRKRSGHLFQGRFKALLIEKEAYFAEVLRYVVLNPVRAHMVERPEEYNWSSYQATAGYHAAPDWFDLKSALEFFHPDRDAAQSNYKEFVCAAIADSEALWDKVTLHLSWNRGVDKEDAEDRRNEAALDRSSPSAACCRTSEDSHDRRRSGESCRHDRRLDSRHTRGRTPPSGGVDRMA